MIAFNSGLLNNLSLLRNTTKPVNRYIPDTIRKPAYGLPIISDNTYAPAILANSKKKYQEE